MTIAMADPKKLSASRGITEALAAKSRARRNLARDLANQELAPIRSRNDLCPRLALVERDLESLRPAARRIRKADAAQIGRIKHSLQTYGICVPVLITGTGEIIDGHAVVEAARQLGLTSISCIVIDHLSRAEIRKLRISLNRIAEKGSWLPGELSLEVAELAVEFGADFHIPGLDSDELDSLLLDNGALEGGMDRIPPVAETAVSRIGDIWEIGTHRIGCGSARDLVFIRRIIPPGCRIVLCLTDPPYGVPIAGHVTGGDHREFVEGAKGTTKEQLQSLFDESLGVIVAVLDDGGLCLAFIDWRGLAAMSAAAEKSGLSQINLIVWAKTNGGMGSLWRSQHELLPAFKKGTAPHINNVRLGRKGRYRSNLWTYPGASSLGSDARDGLQVHPTVKPVALLEDAILDVSNRGDAVFDPFAGSGSTLIAAHRTGRLFCGSELDPLYVDVILRRFRLTFGVEATLVDSGQTFSEVELARAEGADSKALTASEGAKS